ncbi:DUF3396 domain-containing protein [Sinorhizobium sp. RAC02]|uniref:DUF3396 domain-containing protein n=1 Tax=Sinorhizobium sp. RAC02 TaxID=1842534 RepID=UPI001237708A|nr:DUF3396 domain-containing protein [Sinorhizobium sp. RAC02]
MIEFLTYEGAPIAVPAFRIIAVLEGDIHDEANRPGLTRAYGMFEAAFDEAADTASYNFPGHKGKLRKITASLKKDGRAFFAREETSYGEGLRRYSRAFADFEEPALPFFGVEQRSYECFLELDLPADDARILSLAEDIAGELGRTRTIWAVMGMGFFLPPYKSSLAFMLGRSIGRYRTGIDISPSMVTDGLRREGSAHRWKEDEQPGIPDLGWKTFIGREFWPRIPDVAVALKAEPDITVEELDNALVITAGDRPIWGDVDQGEDISAYYTVAKHLSPIAYPVEAGKAFMFGGDTYDAGHVARVEAYLTRYMQAYKKEGRQALTPKPR